MLTALGFGRTQVINIYDSLIDWVNASPFADQFYHFLDTVPHAYDIFNYVMS